jgi:hypothetical protein
MTTLKQNGYKFPALQSSDLDFKIKVPSLIVCSCEAVLKFLSEIPCTRCSHKICENCTKKSSFPDFNLREEIQVCAKCFEDLAVPLNSNKVFKLRIMQLIKRQQNFTSNGKFLLPEHPFSNCVSMENLFQSGRFSDLRLIAGTGKVFKVHKFVLAGE